jgi:hypothetical protein
MAVKHFSKREDGWQNVGCWFGISTPTGGHLAESFTLGEESFFDVFCKFPACLEVRIEIVQNRAELKLKN